MHKIKTKKPSAKNTLFDLQVFLDTAGAARRIIKYARSENIYSQGDPANGVMYIQAGGVKLTVINEDGKEAVVAILGPPNGNAKAFNAAAGLSKNCSCPFST